MPGQAPSPVSPNFQSSLARQPLSSKPACSPASKPARAANPAKNKNSPGGGCGRRGTRAGPADAGRSALAPALPLVSPAPRPAAPAAAPHRARAPAAPLLAAQAGRWQQGVTQGWWANSHAPRSLSSSQPASLPPLTLHGVLGCGLRLLRRQLAPLQAQVHVALRAPAGVRRQRHRQPRRARLQRLGHCRRGAGSAAGARERQRSGGGVDCHARACLAEAAHTVEAPAHTAGSVGAHPPSTKP